MYYIVYVDLDVSLSSLARKVNIDAVDYQINIHAVHVRIHFTACATSPSSVPPGSNKRTNERTNKQTNERTNKRTNKQTNEQTNERTIERTNGTSSSHPKYHCILRIQHPIALHSFQHMSDLPFTPSSKNNPCDYAPHLP
jgi:hypothetical protein